MFCTRCGREIADDSNYCKYCGNKINWLIDTDIEPGYEANSFSDDNTGTACTICKDCNVCRNCCGCHGCHGYNNVHNTNIVTATLDGMMNGIFIMASIPLLPIVAAGKLLGYAADKVFSTENLQNTELLKQSAAEKHQRDMERKQREMTRQDWETDRLNAVLKRRQEVQEKRAKLMAAGKL